MSIAIDSSVLIEWEKTGNLANYFSHLGGSFYVPALAAVEFLQGTHPPARLELRERAKRL